MTERRRVLRFETALTALCDIVSEKREGTLFRVRNISKEGALLVLDKRLKQGDEIKLSMDVPGDNVPVFASCEVAWQRTLAESNDYKTGVRFTRIDAADKGRLLEYIYTEWLKLLDSIK